MKDEPFYVYPIAKTIIHRTGKEIILKKLINALRKHSIKERKKWPNGSSLKQSNTDTINVYEYESDGKIIRLNYKIRENTFEGLIIRHHEWIVEENKIKIKDLPELMLNKIQKPGVLATEIVNIKQIENRQILSAERKKAKYQIMIKLEEAEKEEI